MDIRCIHPFRSALGEGALWSPDEQVLYWLDQIRPEIHRLDPKTGQDTKLTLDLPAQLGALVLRRRGGLILAASDGLSILDLGSQTLTPLANPIASAPRVSFNDAKCDRWGRLWAGTTDRQEAEPLGSLYRIDPDTSWTPIADGFVCSNGPSFSPDGLTMYHTCSHERTIYAYGIVPETGVAYGKRVFATVEVEAGVPDGSTVDAEGYLWSAHWGGERLTRYAPSGAVDRVIHMPVRSLTSCAFGGPKMDTLFVTSASVQFQDGRWLAMDSEGFAAAPMEGGLFALDVGVLGLPEPSFAG